MEPWMWGLVAGVPVVGLGIAYASGAFSTNIPAVDQKIYQEQMKRTEFTGDEDFATGRSTAEGGRRRHKTKKSKSKNKKTKRRG